MFFLPFVPFIFNKCRSLPNTQFITFIPLPINMNVVFLVIATVVVVVLVVLVVWLVLFVVVVCFFLCSLLPICIKTLPSTIQPGGLESSCLHSASQWFASRACFCMVHWFYFLSFLDVMSPFFICQIKFKQGPSDFTFPQAAKLFYLTLLFFMKALYGSSLSSN